MTPALRQEIISLIHQEVVPATGCTEPVAVSLCTAYASARLGNVTPESVSVLLSPNVLKNALGVGIPGTGMIGLPIAIALGIVIAQPDKGLTLLDSFTPEQLAEAKRLVEAKIITIGTKPEPVDKLYAEVTIQTTSGETATAIISGKHDHLTYLAKGDQILEDHPIGQQEEQESDDEELALNFSLVYDFATTAPLEEIEFILADAEVNAEASRLSMKSNYGHAVGRMVQSDLGRKYLGDSALTQIISATSAACDARMDGAPVTVMSNSGSGNQGITATMPVLTFAKEQKKGHEETVRALMLSNLMVIYIKQKLGRLSALCGCVVASTGAACGLTYLLGGNKQQVSYAVKNMVGNITGLLCDGAKPSCSLKVSSGVSTAMFSALLAMEQKVVTGSEGIVDDDVDQTIDNLTSIGRVGMNETDRLVLDIMTSKKH
ncbi:serine dehydratase subunit alpha family protein [uncultured Porphyromonas sp.]|uniref:L-cysteine desulfidase family protein n=1 Tax=uncultured Porphyromonas sp. TaxID=159274 RepID=UPI00262BCD49|nr:L-serine ammonia-lyase, iron-sulfur-dependent, subunit alpha [uncultured Porphyromonas sp.]